MFALRFIMTARTPEAVAVIQVWTSRTEGVESHFLGTLVAQDSFICCFVFVLHVAGEMVYPLDLIAKVSQDNK